ncbi:MAG TPA: LysR family transcriptional regulator [Ramlibacter sp.]|nr:LysR family transcriptional regulator [Ramlibacter sp.]
MKNLDLHLLESFELLMRERSVSRAAEHLGMSQSSASEMLARLRDRFGDPLLVRTRDGLVPTPRAEELLPAVRAAAEQLRSLLERGGGFDPRASNRSFRITTSDYTQLLLMPALARRMLEHAPGCTVDILPVNVLHVEHTLAAGDIDLAMAYFPDPPPSLRRSPLFTDGYACVARPGQAQAVEPLTVEGFAALPHVKVAPSGLSYFSSGVDSALETRGLRRRVALTSPHFLLAAHLVSQSDLVLVLPRQAALALAAFLPLQVLDLPLPIRPVEISMYWHERTHHSPAHQWLREQVRGVLAHPEP